MPNIIINNYCNQKCSYCFAKDNMLSDNKKDMSLSTYLLVLKYLKLNNEDEVRLLWWEPFLFPKIKDFLQISQKWWYKSIIFSNLNFPNKVLKDSITWIRNLTVNININNKDFYSESEILQIKENITFLIKEEVFIYIWYNIIDVDKQADLLFELVSEFNLKHISLKITNSLIWWKLIIDNTDRRLWKYIFSIIKAQHHKYNLYLWCWVEKNIFKENELEYIKSKTNIDLKFWCNWNRWKFDINTDGTIMKCFIFWEDNKNKIWIKTLLKDNTNQANLVEKLNIWVFSEWECYWNMKIKKLI